MLLTEERKAQKVNQEELSSFFFGSKQIAEDVQRSQNDFIKLLPHDPKNQGESRADLLKRVIRDSALLYAEMDKLSPYEDDILRKFTCFTQYDHQLIGSVNTWMFIPMIEAVGTKEQIKKWAVPAQQRKIFGCYAQTELAHGSDVQGLKTTAEYDHRTQSFILNSNGLEGYKFWPGDLGLFCTHAAIIAQLIINGKNYGVQTFVAQIRDPATYNTVEGVEAGDLGSKVGYSSKDNGYMILTNFRIPKESMLAKYCEITENGEFKSQGNQVIGYAVMMKIRVWLIQGAGVVLSRAVTIATRYSIVRTQFKMGGEEVPIINYIEQQNKIFPFIASSYIFRTISVAIEDLYKQALVDIESNNFQTLKDLHLLASGCKSYFSNEMLKGIDVCRRACGGQGFLSASKFDTLYQEFAPFATFEGENTVLFLQTAAQLIKNYNYVMTDREVKSNKLKFFKHFKDLEKFKVQINSSSDITIENIQQIFMVKSILQIQKTSQKLMSGIEKGMDFKQAWDTCAGIDLQTAAEDYIEYYCIEQFIKSLKNQEQSSKKVLLDLGILWCLGKLKKNVTILIVNDFLSENSIKIIGQTYLQKLRDIRPHVISLVDAFLLNDQAVGALGRYDGDVYNTLYQQAKNDNPINFPENRKKLQMAVKKELLKKL